MQVTRYCDAKPYEAPKHFDMRALRLQGAEASNAKFAWTGMSHFLPGGGASLDDGPLEKIYVVLEGEVTVTIKDKDPVTLKKYDSCYIPGGEARSVVNNSNMMATMLVVMPNGAAAK